MGTGSSPIELSDDVVRSRRTAAIMISLAAALTAAAIGGVDPLLSANDRSRWCTVRSLVDHGTYSIDDVLFDTDEATGRSWFSIDIVRHEGSYYSTKPALLPAVVAGVYWCVQAVSGWTLANGVTAVTRTVLLIVNWLPLMLALIVLARLLERYSRRECTRVFVLVTACFGTFLTTFSVTLNNHLPAAVCVIFALYPALRIVVDGERRGRYFILVGFFAAATCTNELPAAFFGLAMFGLMWFQDRSRTLRCFVPAAVVPIALFVATTYIQTGGLKPFYMYYGTEKYEFTFTDPRDGRVKDSYWASPHGIDVPRDSAGEYLLHCTIGHHGIFSLSPVFLLALLGWWRGLKRSRVGGSTLDARSLQPFLLMGLGLTCAVLLFYLSRPQNYNYGGLTCGLRWTFWLIPFWLIAMIPVFDRDEWATGRRCRCGLSGLEWTTVGLLAVSTFSAMYAVDNPWQHPWLYRLMEHWGWIDYR